jgi:YfiH family protein
MEIETKKDIRYLTVPALDRTGRVLHAFTTRQNGLGGRNNGIKLPDDWNAVAQSFGVGPDRLVTVNQIHGERIVKVDDQNYRGMKTVQADAMITNISGFAIGVETADCVPLLLVDPATPAVGAVHAGWRSTAKKIVQKAVKKMQDEFGSDPSRMIAAIGPAIGPECYEVDEPVMGPVREAFSFWKDVASSRGSDKWSLDLVKLNRMELVQTGLDEKNIHSLGMCTSCRKDLFYSFRAEGRTGRMLSVIMIKS